MKKLLPLKQFEAECFKDHTALIIDGYYSYELPASEIKIHEVKDRNFCFTSNFLFLTTDLVKNLPDNKVSLRNYIDTLSPTRAAELAFGAQILNWDVTTQYCGQCGSILKLSESETAKNCSSCNKNLYPHTQPVAIMLIKKGDKLLLAKGLPPRKHYSCLAGFVEAGESLEDCVHREVMEEVGVEIENIRFFGSQSWPFPNNLMMAFMADWKSGEIKIDPNEITDAAWFSKKKPPEVLPPKVSISRQMIDSVWL